MSIGEVSLSRSTQEKWEFVIGALQHNYGLTSQWRRVESPYLPELVLTFKQDPDELAWVVQTCVEQWLASKSPGALDGLLRFLFDPAAESLDDCPPPLGDGSPVAE